MPGNACAYREPATSGAGHRASAGEGAGHGVFPAGIAPQLQIIRDGVLGTRPFSVPRTHQGGLA